MFNEHTRLVCRPPVQARLRTAIRTAIRTRLRIIGGVIGGVIGAECWYAGRGTQVRSPVRKDCVLAGIDRGHDRGHDEGVTANNGGRA